MSITYIKHLEIAPTIYHKGNKESWNQAYQVLNAFQLSYKQTKKFTQASNQSSMGSITLWY